MRCVLVVHMDDGLLHTAVLKLARLPEQCVLISIAAK